MTRDHAEMIALRALVWMAAEEGVLESFLATTGAAAADVAAEAGEPGMQVALLDWLTSRDDWVRGFCDANALPYEAPMRARYALPGGDRVEWT